MMTEQYLYKIFENPSALERYIIDIVGIGYRYYKRSYPNKDTNQCLQDFALKEMLPVLLKEIVRFKDGDDESV